SMLKSRNQYPNGRRRNSTPRPDPLKTDLIARLSRAEGQLRGIQRMIDQGVYCIDVLQQVSAVRRALDRLALILLRDHLATCVTAAVHRDKPEDKINELIGAIDRFLAEATAMETIERFKIRGMQWPNCAKT